MFVGNESIQEGSVRPVILYVDDQPSHRALFKKAFDAAYEVVTASSGEEGLEIVQGREVFLLIADHNMPGMTGIEFLEKAERFVPKAQRAIVSAYLDRQIVQEATRRIRLAEHLKKPWKLDRMRAFIEQSLERYGLQQASEVQIREQESPWDPHYQPVTCNEIVGAFDRIDEGVDRHGARRIFLNFVHPRLKENVPLIRRPCPSILRKAQQEVLRGDVEAFQKSLAEYLKKERVRTILHDASEEPQKTVN